MWTACANVSTAWLRRGYARNNFSRASSWTRKLRGPKLGVEQIEELARLAPMGQGNPMVRLAARGLRHQMPPRTMGRENQHVKFSLTDGHQTLDAVWWNGGAAEWPENRFDIAFSPRSTTTRGGARSN